MGEKRFHQFGLWVIDNPNFNGISIVDLVDTELMSITEVVDLLNKQQSEINSLKIELKLISGEKLFSRRELERKVDEQQAEIERLQKIIDLTQYQLKVQDRILKEIGE